MKSNRAVATKSSLPACGGGLGTGVGIAVIRSIILALLVCCAQLFCAGRVSADVAVPPLSGRVVDQTGTLTSSDIASLTQKLESFEARKGSQITVLIVPTTAPETIEQYSIRVAEAWKIGRTKVDDGAILLVAKDDRKLRIEVGYGLEGALTDVTGQRIIDEIVTPKFRTGDFAGGISAGVDRIIGVIDGEPLPAPKRQQDYGPSNHIDDLFNPFVIFGIFIAGGILRGIFGRLIGSVATGGVAGVLVWLVVGSIAVSGIVAVIAFIFTLISASFASTGGNWSGGGYGGSFPSGRGGGGWNSGGSSNSSGGFSGGGGGFGGGGASGSW
jgi:uncharacterized protein